MLSYSIWIVFENIVLISRYNAMIFEALSTLNDPNGSDNSAIVCFIEVRNGASKLFSPFFLSLCHCLVIAVGLG